MKISNHKINKYIFGSLIATALWACTDKEGPVASGDQDPRIDHISVALMTRGEEGDGINSDETLKRDYGMPFALKFDANSVVFVSQQTETRYPYQKPEQIYAYKFMEDAEADWEDGYNFTPLDLDDPLEWFKIGNGGTYRNGFALYALYFPLQNEISQRTEGGKIIYSVQQDQSTLENLIKSDILGAYHSTPTLFTRLRFNLFHLMTYLRIRLYVPVYDSTSKTGYYDNALISADLDKTTTDFAIQWSIIPSSDSSGPVISPLSGDGTIEMYMHPVEDGEDRELKSIKYTDFIPKDYFEQPIEGDYDNVRVYDFSVIMPMQKNTTDENGKDQAYAQTNFLNFFLRSNSGATNKYYFNQTLKANTTNNNIQLNQGVFQFMELYVPRVGNKVIYVGGTLTPWSHHFTSLPLHNEDDNENNQ